MLNHVHGRRAGEWEGKKGKGRQLRSQLINYSEGLEWQKIELKCFLSARLDLLLEFKLIELFCKRSRDVD